MESTTKIHLSAEEAGLISNTEWILTKRDIVEKVYQMFGQINEMMKLETAGFDHLFTGTQYLNGKISRGENYRLLPWVILDYPYYFSRHNVFAIRTMFWWGNFFSITLHLSGDCKTRFINSDTGLILFLKKNNFFVCVNDREWEHHFEENNYVPAADLSNTAFLQVTQKPFFKVAKKTALSQWENADSFIIGSFKQILILLQINFQGDKKDP